MRSLPIIALLLAACATTMYEREGSTREDFYREDGQCDAQASAVPGPALQQLRVYESCMRGKGWHKAK